jgi:excinuclease ABC subunit C
VLYVGKAKSLRNRVRTYLHTDFAQNPIVQRLVASIADVDTIVVPDEAQSLLLENNLIKELKPRFNVRLKDDKSYPSIVVTGDDPFPRVLVTRRRNIPKARYFGPYTDVANMRRTLTLIRRLFTVRSCSDDIPRHMRERPCLDYYIGKCKAPCVGWQSKADYRAMIDEVLEFLDGKTLDVRARVRDMMHSASERQDFERAAALRDTLKWLEQIETNQAVETIGQGSADVIGYARDGDDAVGVWLRLRKGRVVSREHRFLENVESEADPDVLSAFLVRYYVTAEDRVRRLVLPLAPSNFESLERLAPGTQIRCPQRGIARCPQRGIAGRWLALAEQNARHLLESLRIESFETDERAAELGLH